MSAPERRPAQEISNAVVQELATTTGRGPTRARTTFGQDAVFVVLQDTLTEGEHTLVDAGEETTVLDLRRKWQKVMRESCSKRVEEVTGRKVIGFMSDNYVEPDLAVEVFILEPEDASSGGKTVIPLRPSDRA